MSCSISPSIFFSPLCHPSLHSSVSPRHPLLTPLRPPEAPLRLSFHHSCYTIAQNPSQAILQRVICLVNLLCMYSTFCTYALYPQPTAPHLLLWHSIGLKSLLKPSYLPTPLNLLSVTVLILLSPLPPTARLQPVSSHPSQRVLEGPRQPHRHSCGPWSPPCSQRG